MFSTPYPTSRVRWRTQTDASSKMGKGWVDWLTDVAIKPIRWPKWTKWSNLHVSLSLSLCLCLYITVSIQLMASMEELRQCRIQQKNIASTIDKLQMCLPGNNRQHTRTAHIFKCTRNVTVTLIQKLICSFSSSGDVQQTTGADGGQKVCVCVCVCFDEGWIITWWRSYSVQFDH